MSARNFFHDSVARALVADGWTITHDPLTLSFGGRDLFVDLGAERQAIAAERGNQRIAVEIQSFVGRSVIRDLEDAVGQYDIFRTILAETEPDRQVYLAVPQRTYEGLFSEHFGQFIVARLKLRLVVFSEDEEKIVQWIE